MADITHTLGIDESEFVRGLKRAEDQAKGMGRGLQDATASVKSMQEGFQRVQGLVLGTSAAISAAAFGLARVASGVVQYINAGEFVQKELEAHKQITVELNAQLTRHQQITREIEARYQGSLAQIGATSADPQAMAIRFAERVWSKAVAGRESDSAVATYARLLNPAEAFSAIYRATTEGDARDALTMQAVGTAKFQATNAAEGQRGNYADLDFTRQRLQLEKDIAATRFGNDPLAGRATSELSMHADRIARIKQIDGLDRVREQQLIDMENERFTLAMQNIDAERVARQQAADERAAREQKAFEERNKADQERQRYDEQAIASSLESLRISNLRAEGKAKEAEQAEITARYESVRQNIERSSASEAAKRDALAKLGEQRTAALALAGRPEELRTGMRSVGTGLGEQATRQALGGGPGRAIERTTTGIAVDLRKAVEILNKMSSAAPIARLI